MKEFIFLNGKLTRKDEGCVSVRDPGFLFGWGAFETMRFKKGGTVYLDEHLNRLHASCRVLNIELSYSFEKLRSAIHETVKKNAFPDARVRLSVWRKEKGCGLLITAVSYHPLTREKYSRGFKLWVSGLRQDEYSVLSHVKSMNRLLYELSFEQARANGCDEALILNSRGHVAECSRANIFLVKDKELFTPALKCGCLNGVTRMAVLDFSKQAGIKLFEADLTIKDLEDADEVFLTNSLFGIMPARSIEGKRCCRTSRLDITRLLSDKYLELWNSRK